MRKVLLSILLIGVLGFSYFTFKKSLEKSPMTNFGEKNVSLKNDVEIGNKVRVITIQAERFKFSQETMNIKKGEKVKIVIENMDIEHGIMIPELVFPPTQKSFTEVNLQVDKEGEYKFYCSNEICGRGHGKMTGKIIVS